MPGENGSVIPGKLMSEEEIRKLARERLNEIPEQREKDIKAIKKWIKSQPHLGDKANCDDKFILNFLRGCKFSFEKTKSKIDTWHTVRTHCPEMFDNWDMDDPKIEAMIAQGINVPLKGFDKHGRKVILIRSSFADRSKCTFADTIKVSLMINEMWMQFYGEQQGAVNGVVIINDLGGADAGMATSLSPAFLKKAMIVFQDAYPSNPKENHMLNLPPVMEKICTLMLSFANEKMRNRTRFYAKGGDFGQLHDAVGKDVLPEEYGGNAGPLKLQTDEILVQMKSHKDWVRNQSKYKSNESKRPGSQRSYADVFGMEGSFRQLEFD